MNQHSAARRRHVWYAVGLGAALALVTAGVLALVNRRTTPVLSRRGITKVEVLNGCGKHDVARRFSELLRQERFDVVYTGNAKAFCFCESIVLDRSGDISKAEEVARVLRIPNVLQQINADPFRREDVTVIVGRDYDLLEPLLDQDVH